MSHNHSQRPSGSMPRPVTIDVIRMGVSRRTAPRIHLELPGRAARLGPDVRSARLSGLRSVTLNGVPNPTIPPRDDWALVASTASTPPTRANVGEDRQTKQALFDAMDFDPGHGELNQERSDSLGAAGRDVRAASSLRSDAETGGGAVTRE